MRAARNLALLSAVCLATAAVGSRAETPESKRAVILELIRISGGDGAAQLAAQAFLAQIRLNYGAMVEQVLEEERDLAEEERQLLRERLSDFDRFAAAFSARFAESIDLAEVRETVYVPLYDAHFEEQELREIVAFYRTPAGRKALAVMPSVMEEGYEATVLMVEPRVVQLVGEILAEERTRVLPE